MELFYRELKMKTKQLISLELLVALLLALLMAFSVSGCSEDKAVLTEAEKLQVTKEMGQIKGAEYFVGSLTETFNAGGYSYAKLSTAKGDIWAAGPITKLNKDDKVSFSSKMLMKNFRSKSTERDFKEIYFAKSFTVNGKRTGMIPMAKTSTTVTKKNPHNNASMPHGQAMSSTPLIKPIEKATKGHDIAEIIAKANTLRGKTVIVRGQVTKVTSNILGANWVHIRDSSTEQDLTITTSGTTKTGDIVLVKGTLSLNKDFGKGFVIGRVIADASVKVE